MPTIQRKIADRFLAVLAESKDVDAEKVAAIRALLAAGKRVKADDLVRIFSVPASGDLK